MARSFANVKAVSSLLIENLSLASSRRGFAASASQGMSVTSRSDIMRMTGKSGAGKEETQQGGGDSSAWIPDPVTGYYRPGNSPQEIDVAELRERLFKQRRSGSQ